MKTKMKRFLSWNPHHSDGFTLVELIVVIAILAILAAVAIPAYSGYIEKSKRAGDEVLLSAVNKAFASACLLNGHDVTEVIASELDMEEGCVIGIESITLIGDASTFAMRSAELGVELEGAAVAAYEEAFLEFFGENKNTKFEVIKSLAFDALTHQFVDPETTEVEDVTYNGVVITVNKEDIEKFKASGWYQLGSEKLLGLVNQVTDIAEGVGGVFGNMLADPAFIDACAEALGFESTAAYTKYLQDSMSQWQTENPEDATNVGDYYSHLMVNSAVLVSAKGAQTTGDTIIDLLLSNGNEDENAKTVIKKNMTNDPETGLSQATLAYGLYYSFKTEDSGGNPPDVTNKSDFSRVYELLDAAEDPDHEDYAEGIRFKTYLETGNGKTDLIGCIAAMNVVSSNSNKTGVGTSIIENGFGDKDLKDAVDKALGN